MKNWVVFLVFVALSLSLMPAAFAKTPSDKLTRGLANVVTGGLEIP